MQKLVGESGKTLVSPPSEETNSEKEVGEFFNKPGLDTMHHGRRPGNIRNTKKGQKPVI